MCEVALRITRILTDYAQKLHGHCLPVMNGSYVQGEPRLVTDEPIEFEK